MKLLKEIANIRSGYTFRRGIEEATNGQFRVVQIKDLAGNGNLSEVDLVKTDLPFVRGDNFVRSSDILFASRGMNKQAVAISSTSENTIFSYQLFAITPNSSIMPEYLAWYINQKPAQRYIEEHSMGSNVKTISKEALAYMPIEIPPIEIQRRIVEINKLFQREIELVSAIEEKRGKLVEAALLEVIKSET
jgi:restriction endonuclease S subunit